MIHKLVSIIEKAKGKKEVRQKFLARLNEGRLIRSENPRSHFCVYFAAIDPSEGMAFIGLHKKSGLWLFNGGHLDPEETLEQALVREAREEWGIPIDPKSVQNPELCTITKIEHPERQVCEWHYDFWYFLPFARSLFHPDPARLSTEFLEYGWYSYPEARRLMIDPASREAIDFIENHLSIT